MFGKKCKVIQPTKRENKRCECGFRRKGKHHDEGSQHKGINQKGTKR